MRHLAEIQVPPAFLRFLSALPVVAGVVFALAKLASILPA